MSPVHKVDNFPPREGLQPRDARGPFQRRGKAFYRLLTRDVLYEPVLVLSREGLTTPSCNSERKLLDFLFARPIGDATAQGLEDRVSDNARLTKATCLLPGYL